MINLDELLRKIKIRLEIDPDDNSKDSLFEVLIEDAISYIKRIAFLNENEVNENFHSVIRKMVVFDFRRQGVENLKTETAGSLQENFVTEYPKDILDEITPYRKIRV